MTATRLKFFTLVSKVKRSTKRLQVVFVFLFTKNGSHHSPFPAHADSDRLQVYSCWVSSVKLNIFCKAMSWTFLAIHKKIPTSSCLNNWIPSPSTHTHMTPSNWHVEWVRSLAPPHQCAWSFNSENKCDSQIPDTVKIQSISERVKKTRRDGCFSKVIQRTQSSLWAAY